MVWLILPLTLRSSSLWPCYWLNLLRISYFKFIWIILSICWDVLNLRQSQILLIFYIAVFSVRDLVQNLIKFWLFYYSKTKPNSLIFLKFDKFKMTTIFAFAILLTLPHDINLIAQICFFVAFVVGCKVCKA